MCRRVGVALALPVLVHRVEQLGRGRETNVSRSRQSGHSRSRSAGVMRPCSPVSCSCRRKPGWRCVELAQLARRRSRRRRCARSAGARRRRAPSSRSRLRSMLMIGVIPLPALMNSSLPRQRVGQHEGRPRRRRGGRSCPARAARTRYGDTLPVVDELRRDADAAVGAAGVRGERVGAPVVDAVDDHADPQVLARAGARATPSPGWMTTVTASGVSRSMRSIRPRSSCVDHSGLISSR